MRAAGFVVGAIHALAALAATGACGNGGQPLLVGANEPLRVRGAQLIAGTLPGSAPIPEPDAGGDAGAPPPPPNAVTDVSSQDPVVVPGAAGKKFSGRAIASAVAIAVRFPELGSGYWVLPVSASDPQFPGEITWEVNADFNASIPTGNHMLRFVAIDGNGNAGPQRDFKLCLASRVPDNLNSCDTANPPPEAVISLQWDANVDLDLQVTTPDGRVVDAKHPTTIPIDAGRPGPENGVIDRDSLGACVPDSLRQEDLVFQQRPHGTFSLAVNLFDACKKPGATFHVVVYEASGDGADRHLEETYRRSGRVIDIDANGGAKPGLFIVDYPFGN